MNPNLVFAIQSTVVFIAYALVLIWFVTPKLRTLALEDALIPLLAVHVFRVAGLTFLLPNVTAPDIPRDFAVPAAWGDLTAAVLALLAMIALHYRKAYAIALVWIFNVEGFVDLLVASFLALRENLGQYRVGPMWYVLVFWVPAFVLSHLAIFRLLIRPRTAGVPAG